MLVLCPIMESGHEPDSDPGGEVPFVDVWRQQPRWPSHQSWSQPNLIRPGQRPSTPVKAKPPRRVFLVSLPWASSGLAGDRTWRGGSVLLVALGEG